MNLSQFIHILLARYKIVLLVFLVTILTTLIVSILLPKSYKATTTVLIASKGADPVTGLSMPIQLMPGFMATQLDVISSTKTALMVIDGLKMDQNPNIKKHLFWGTRTQASVNIYDAYLNEAKHKQLLTTCNIAYSKEGNKTYVQDIVAQKDNIIASVLEQKGVVMICGSVAMQTCVLDQLDTICQSNFSNNVSYFIDNGQIKMDCY